MIAMKKLISSGVPGSDEGYVRRGREFEVSSEHRAKELEEAGLAVRLNTTPVNNSFPRNNSEVSAENKAAADGPFVSPGGETGAETAPSSSDQDHQPRQRRLRKPEVGLDL